MRNISDISASRHLRPSRTNSGHAFGGHYRGISAGMLMFFGSLALLAQTMPHYQLDLSHIEIPAKLA
jgi:hypothetical protein